MGIGIDLAFNPPLPDVCISTDGKFLAEQLGTLDDLAAIAGVPPLTAYMDQRVPDEDDEMDLNVFMARWSDWFPAADGLRSAEGLLAALEANPETDCSDDEIRWLTDQLTELRECLVQAAARQSQFRIEIIM